MSSKAKILSVNDNQLDIVANSVYKHINKGVKKNKYTEVMIDPATMIMVAGLIIELVKMVKKCRTEKEVIKSAKKPTMFEKRVLYRVIRKKLTWRQYFKRRNEISDAIFNTGASMTEEEVFKLFEEVSD